MRETNAREIKIAVNSSCGVYCFHLLHFHFRKNGRRIKYDPAFDSFTSGCKSPNLSKREEEIENPGFDSRSDCRFSLFFFFFYSPLSCHPPNSFVLFPRREPRGSACSAPKTPRVPDVRAFWPSTGSRITSDIFSSSRLTLELPLVAVSRRGTRYESYYRDARTSSWLNPLRAVCSTGRDRMVVWEPARLVPFDT